MIMSIRIDIIMLCSWHNYMGIFVVTIVASFKLPFSLRPWTFVLT